MDPSELLRRLRTEARHVTAFAAQRDLDAPVPSCPGMTVRDVIQHLGSVHRRVTEWVRVQAPPADWEREPPGPDLIGWFAEGADLLYAELSAHPPGEVCDTPWPHDRTVGFWCRRMAHETTVHRTDVESAYGPIGPVDAELAADGADEVLTLYLVHRLGGEAPGWSAVTRPPGTGEVVGVCADRHLWRVTLTTKPDVSRQLPDDADAIIVGTAPHIYLWLWGRLPDTTIRINGTPTAATTLRTALTAATQ